MAAMVEAKQDSRVCVFGDSHFACVKKALDEGRVDPAPYEVEFWGNAGNRFRYLRYADDAIQPVDEFTARRFAKFNTHGRTELRPDPFEMVLFSGCRLRVNRLFMEFLHRSRHDDLRLSLGLQRAVATAHFRSHPPYQFARRFAAQGKARIVFAPVSLQTAGMPDPHIEGFPDARLATAEERAAIWEMLESIMAEDGITLWRQPDDTVVDGCFTDARYAVEDAEARGDATHKNAAYGARVLQGALDILRAEGRAAA